MNLKSRVFVSLYLLVIIYLTLTFVYGRTGLVSTKELLSYRNQIYSNIAELKKINATLARKLEPLNTMEQIRLKAREMGYIAADEKKIFLEGLEKQDIYHSLGTIIYRQEVSQDNSQFIRSMSLIFSLLFYIISSILLSLRDGTQKNSRSNKNNFTMPPQQRDCNNTL